MVQTHVLLDLYLSISFPLEQLLTGLLYLISVLHVRFYYKEIQLNFVLILYPVTLLNLHSSRRFICRGVDFFGFSM